MKSGSGTADGAYRLVSQLDRRGRFLAYHAFFRVPERQVVFKTIATEGLEPSELAACRERFGRACQVAKILQHVAIANVYDSGEVNGTYYFAEEYLEAKSLAKIQVEEGRRFAWKEILSIAEQLASALDYAHAQNVIHRDLRPANIFLFDSGQVKLTDFSVAQIDLKAAAQTASVVRYLSPEQVNHEELDRRSNVFSLGAILYELAGGNPPFPGDDYKTVSQMVLYGDPGPSQDLDRTLTPELKSKLLRALAKSPHDRYPNCSDFVQELKTIPDPPQVGVTTGLAPVTSAVALATGLGLPAAEAKDGGTEQERATQLDSVAKNGRGRGLAPEPEIDRITEVGAHPEPMPESALGAELFTAAASGAPAREIGSAESVRVVSQQPASIPEIAVVSPESASAGVAALDYVSIAPDEPIVVERPPEQEPAEAQVVEQRVESAREAAEVAAEPLVHSSGSSPVSSPSPVVPPPGPLIESPEVSAYPFRLGPKPVRQRFPWPFAVGSLALLLVAGVIIFWPSARRRNAVKDDRLTSPQSPTTNQRSDSAKPPGSPGLTSRAHVSVPNGGFPRPATAPEPNRVSSAPALKSARPTPSMPKARAMPKARGELPKDATASSTVSPTMAARPMTSVPKAPIPAAELPHHATASSSMSPAMVAQPKPSGPKVLAMTSELPQSSTTRASGEVPETKNPEPPAPKARSEAVVPPTTGQDSAVSAVLGLLVSSNIPDARISIDGRSEADWIAPHLFADLSPGPHQLIVYKPGYKEYRRVVNLADGGNLLVQGVLAPAIRGPSELDIITDPPGAEVLVDGRPCGLSPVKVVVAVGQHTYTIRQPGYPPYQGTVEVKEGSVITRRVTWTPL